MGRYLGYYLTYQDGYEAAGLTQRHSEALKWGTDYFIGCHTADHEFIGQIGDGCGDQGA